MIRRIFFNRIEKNRIGSGIKIRDNASSKSVGSPYHAECAREKMKLRFRSWANLKNYSKRCAVEGVFPSLKKAFGETVKASSVEGITREVVLKFLFYQMIVNYGKGSL